MQELVKIKKIQGPNNALEFPRMIELDIDQFRGSNRKFVSSYLILRLIEEWTKDYNELEILKGKKVR